MKEAQFSLEKSMARLREILDEMQKHSMNFDDNVKLFKEGTALLAQARKHLDESELLIKSIIEAEEEKLEDLEL